MHLDRPSRAESHKKRRTSQIQKNAINSRIAWTQTHQDLRLRSSWGLYSWVLNEPEFTILYDSCSLGLFSGFVAQLVWFFRDQVLNSKAGEKEEEGGSCLQRKGQGDYQAAAWHVEAGSEEWRIKLPKQEDRAADGCLLSRLLTLFYNFNVSCSWAGLAPFFPWLFERAESCSADSYSGLLLPPRNDLPPLHFPQMFLPSSAP